MYRWDPCLYHSSSSAQSGWASDLLEKLRFQGNERVLDIGCGDGKITADIAKRVPRGRVTGIDSSPDMIGFARRHYTGGEVQNLSFEVCDMRELPFINEFNLVFSNASMHWVKEHEKVLKCIQRALVPGGRMLVQMGGKGNAAAVFAVIEKVISNERYAGYFMGFQAPYAFYGPEDYLPWLHQAGLIPVRVELLPKMMVQHGYEGLSGWIKTTWHPYLERIPEDLQTRFIKDIYEHYIANHQPDHQGNIMIDMVRLEVEAQKPLK